MANDPVQDALKGAKATLEKANKFTQSVEGNPTSAFAAKKPVTPHIPQAKKPTYDMAAEARDAAEGIKRRQDTFQQLADQK
jgi:hypothetical protein